MVQAAGAGALLCTMCLLRPPELLKSIPLHPSCAATFLQLCLTAMSSYVSPTKGWPANTEVSGVGRDRGHGEVTSGSKPQWQQPHQQHWQRPYGQQAGRAPIPGERCPADHQFQLLTTAAAANHSAPLLPRPGEDPYVPDPHEEVVGCGDDDDDEGWEALGGGAPPAKRPAPAPPTQGRQQGPQAPQGGAYQQQQWQGGAQFDSGGGPQDPPAAPTDAPMCYCGEPCAQRTSNTPANPGRQFYKCSKARDDPSVCKFFQWADEPSRAGPGG